MKRSVIIILVFVFFIIGVFIGLYKEDIGNQKGLLKKFFEHEKKDVKIEDVIRKIGAKKIVFLVLGLDYNWVEDHRPTSQGARSDTIILVTFDLYDRQVRLMSVPRDLRVFYDDYGYYEKINAAVVLGGPRLTKKILSNLFSIHVDYIFVVKQVAIKNLIDSIGGVYIDVEKDMFYEDKWGNLKIDLKKGKQLLNGEQVIGYMRFRMDEEGDLGRIRRQNQAIIQIMQQLPSKINSSNMFKIINNVLPYIDTDLDKEKIMILVDFMSDFSVSYKFYKLPVNPVEIEGISYVELMDNYKEAIIAWYKGYERLSILNACSNDNNKQIFDKYIKNGKFYLISNEYLDDYIPISVIIKKTNEKPSLYYRLPFGKIMDLSEFLYNRYIYTGSEIYLHKRELYSTEVEKIKRFYDNSDVLLILGEDSVEK